MGGDRLVYVWRRDLVIARRCGEVVEVLSVGGRFHATIGLAWTLCHFGGWRPWFSCPDCGRRVAVLYIVSAVRCRHCLNLSYNSKRGRVKPSHERIILEHVCKRQAREARQRDNTYLALMHINAAAAASDLSGGAKIHH